MTSTRRRFIAIAGTAAALAPASPVDPPAPVSARSRARALAVQAARRFTETSAALDLAAAVIDAGGDRDESSYKAAEAEWRQAGKALRALFPLVAEGSCGLIADGRIYLVDPGPDPDYFGVIVVPLARVADLSR